MTDGMLTAHLVCLLRENVDCNQSPTTAFPSGLIMIRLQLLIQSVGFVPSFYT